MKNISANQPAPILTIRTAKGNIIISQKVKLPHSSVQFSSIEILYLPIKSEYDHYFYQIILKLDNLDISTSVPYLRTFLAIPAEWEDIISGCKSLRNLDQILECPLILCISFSWEVYLSPLWSLWSCSFRCCYQVSGIPARIIVWPRKVYEPSCIS